MVLSLTVIVPSARNPSVSREVPAFSGTLPVPVAGAPAADDGLDVPDELELPDDEEDELLADEVVLLELPVTEARALCTASLSCELTRLSAV